MRILLLYVLLLLSVPRWASAQGENNIWAFSPQGGANLVLNFNLNPVGIATVPIVSGTGMNSIAVCYPNGQLRFVVVLSANSPSGTQNNIYHPDGTPIAGSNLLTGMLTDGCMPVVIPRPGNADQYYVIYSYANGLLYTLLDMSLNNGSGAVVSGQKNIVFAPYGTIMAEKMVPVQGCNGIWLIAHARTANGYFSFQVTASGIDTAAIYSPVGNFTLADYHGTMYPDFLKVSPDGKHIAVTAWKGIEIYDFEKCSGKLRHARILDTTGNSAPFSAATVNNNYTFRDVCFSPDGSKLYATLNHPDGSPEPVTAGKLYQYDLGLPVFSAVINSKSLILTNYPSLTPDISSQCVHVTPNPLGLMKSGPDGKLYIDNGSFTCADPANVPAGYNPGAAFHTVDFPNLAGLACQPHHNTIIVAEYNNNIGRSFYYGVSGGSSALQQIIVTPPVPPDTIPGITYHPVACFSDSLLLMADSTGGCYFWDDGSKERQRMVRQSGTYFVRYFKDCNYTTDTFQLTMIHLPVLTANETCPGMFMGRIAATVDSSQKEPLNYIWKNQDGGILRQFSGATGDTIAGLDSGTYFLQVTTSSGCDTTLSATVAPLPKPDVIAFPADTTIRYGDSIMLRVTGALFYAWYPSGSLDSANKSNPIAKPLQPTRYAVLGIAQNGCADTGYVVVNIDYTMPDFVPNAFSPNGDGRNDVFCISGISYQKLIAFRVYNRFGQLIFSTMDGFKGWDGNQNGRPCDAGTYFYFIQLDYPDHSRKTYKGDVVLIR
jgi:gliding motility-associated-like protein